MTEFPFPITIRPVSSSARPQTVTCVALLRSLGRKRKVLDAIWDQRPVILKLFTSPARAKYHAVREWKVLKLLKERELNSPALLFYGRPLVWKSYFINEYIEGQKISHLIQDDIVG